MAEAGGYHSVNVAVWVNTEVTRVGDPITDPKGDHRHPGCCTVVIAVEVGGGNHPHPAEGKCLPPQPPT